MKPDLYLNVHGGGLSLFRSHAPSPLRLLRAWVLRRDAPTHGFAEADNIHVTCTPEDVAGGLQQLSAQLSASGLALTGNRLFVRVGFGASRMGVARLSGRGSSPDAEMLQSFAIGFAKQAWEVDSSSHLILHELSRSRSRLLVCAVARDLLGPLDEWARQHGLRFAFCKAAVLDCLTPRLGGQRRPGERVIVCREQWGTDAAPVLQLVHVRDQEVTATWRVWTGTSELDDTLEIAREHAKRFLASCQCDPGVSVLLHAWTPAGGPMEGACLSIN
jgi:hypothetical protein